MIHTDEHLIEKSNIEVDTLILSVKAQESLNYRKLPQKKLCVLLAKDNLDSVWRIPKSYKRENENLDHAILRILDANFESSNSYIEQLYTFCDSSPRGISEVKVSYMILTSKMEVKTFEVNKSLSYKWFEISFVNLASETALEEALISPYTSRYEINLCSSEEADESLRVIIEADHVKKSQEPEQALRIVKTEKMSQIDSKILAYGIERLRNKIEYTDILFHLMPQSFTLTELQQVQELILDEKIYTAHFRRKIEPKLFKCTDQVTIAKGHRPAQQYAYNPKWNWKVNLGGV